MRFTRLILHNLSYYWRTNLAVVAGVGASVTVLSGALFVGQSVRASLRTLMYERLGRTQYVLASDRFFHEDLARRLSPTGGSETSSESCPMVYLQGSAVGEASGRRAYHVNIYGVDGRFFEFQGERGEKPPEGQAAFVGSSLAEKLGIETGGVLLIRIETQQGIPKESLYGRKENAGRTLRLTCSRVLPAGRLGEFALRPKQGDIYSVFLSMQRLQEVLDQPMRVNAALLAPEAQEAGLPSLRASLQKNFKLEDLGIRLRLLSGANRLSVESTRIVLEDPIAQAAFKTASDQGMESSGIFTYLANSIRSGGREIPYSVITAADFGRGALDSVERIETGRSRQPPDDHSAPIWLNEWAARDLGVTPGEPVEVDYYVWQEDGQLVTRTAVFHLAGIYSMGGDIDSSLAPDFPGITKARSISAWDPPFPLDLSRIRKTDEDYWNRYKAAPKAFVTLARGRELWRTRFGSITAIRISPSAGKELKSCADEFAAALRIRLDPEQNGFALSAVRNQGIEASRGSTDFGEYFVYFSFFLIASAILLSALFFRLGVEHRARETGLLLAAGFRLRTVRRIFQTEGLILSGAGAVLGLLGSVAYGWLMVYGLRTWWVGAVGTIRLQLHLSWPDYALGSAIGIIAAFSAVAWTLRGLSGNSPRALLAGAFETAGIPGRRTRRLSLLSAAAFVGALLTLAGAALDKVPEVEGFFGAGFFLLISMLSLSALFLRSTRTHPIGGYGWSALLRLGIRNAGHRPGRSLFCIALIASATFIIVSVEAFRQDTRSVSTERSSGTGGCSFIAGSSLPIIYDPDSATGRESLGLDEPAALQQVRFLSFRLRQGDDASCLNLYAPREPTLLGAPHSFVSENRFSFQNSLASTAEQKQNPWLLLESGGPDEPVPAIADANTIQYILHLALGREFTVRGDSGTPVGLRLVGALRDSILQGEVLISERRFLRAFPRQEGYRFFLLEAPVTQTGALIQLLEDRLSDWGFSVESSAARLNAYHRVENTYLSTFQSLGVLGLVLGTLGLATVLLRNVLERRKELALLSAMGYTRRTLAAIIVAENTFLMASGLASGTACALLAILPALHVRGLPIPGAMAVLILLAVLSAGLAASLLAVVAALHSPLLAALHSE